MTYSAFHLSIKSSSSKFTKFHYYLSIVTRYSWHNLFDCNLQTLLVDQSPEDVSRETTAPLPIRALGTRRPCLELKSVRLRRKAASGDPEVPREATSPRHLMCPHSLTRNNSSLGESQVRRGVGLVEGFVKCPINGGSFVCFSYYSRSCCVIPLNPTQSYTILVSNHSNCAN